MGDIRGFRTREVRHLLGCSDGKLKSLCAAGRIKTKKIGGTIYYNKDDIKRLLTSGF
ncbi:helix-turn-helix domain-containing protein [Puia sp. P3]|uniref:helix-turn-helix domain-containing protein n=1 Tax=Puia sp. P3 TaxID=3423952 RepID=UPI003D67F8A2